LIAGDGDEWGRAYLWLWPTAHAIAHKKLSLKYPANVEDVAIESITKLIQRVPVLEPPPTKVVELKALLSRITDNKAHDFIRQRSAQKRPIEEPFGEDEETGWTIEPPDEWGDLAKKLSGRSIVTLIGELAEQLKPIELEVYKCRYELNLKLREISQKLGIPIGSVGVHMSKIHEKLRKELRKLGEDFI
jgi:RNA polymerase sigma factor (sigma-70 family)